MTKVVFNPNPPAPVCIIYDTHNGPHWEGPGVFHLYKKMYVKRQSNPRFLQVCSILRCTAHIQPSKIILKYDFEKCASYLHNNRGN